MSVSRLVKIIWVLGALCSLLSAAQVFAIDQPVGIVLDAHANHLDLKWLPAASVFEGDVIETRRGQWLKIGFQEGTELVVGPMTSIQIANWRGRDRQGYVRRKIFLKEGAVLANVRHVYSQREPFLVSSPHGAVAVLGTSFVFESGLGYPGQLLRDEIMRKNIDDRLTESEREKLKSDLEVRINAMKTESIIHTLSGVVHFARSEDGLEDVKQRISVRAGFVAIAKKLVARPFDEQAFQKYAAKILPKAEIRVDRSLDSGARAAMALEQGSYFDWKSQGRSVASVPKPKVEIRRRGDFLYTKPSGEAALRKDGQISPPEDAFNAKP